MGKYHRVSGMVEQAGLADWLTTLDEGQRRNLKALSSLKVAIKPPAALWAAFQGSEARRIQSSLDRLLKSIGLAGRAIKEKNEDALGTQSESIRDELAGMVKFLSMAKSLSAHSVIPEYGAAVSSGLHSFSLAA